MEPTNVFDAFLPGIDDPSPNGTHIERSSDSRSSHVSEIYNQFDQYPCSQARTHPPDPQLLRERFPSVPRTIPRDTDPYPYASSQSHSASQPSSGSTLQILLFNQPSEDHTSNPMIHLATSHVNHESRSFPSAMEQHHSSTNQSPMTQDPRYFRRRTQWHPPFGQLQGTIHHAAPSTLRHSPPKLINQAPPEGLQNAGRRSPNSTLTPDPYIRLIQSINESNAKLHDAIIKQQETLANHQKILTDYLQTESARSDGYHAKAT